MKKRGYYDVANIVWTLVIFIVITVGIAIGVWIFFSSPIDTRSQEASILSYKIAEALTDDIFLKGEVLEDSFDIIKEASLDRRFFDNGYYYLSIKIEKNAKELKTFFLGPKDLEIQCNTNTEGLAECSQKKLIVRNKSNPEEILEIHILTAVSNKLKNDS